MNAPKEYYPVGYEKNFDDNFQTKVDLPPTTFHCGDQKHFPGLYGDVDLGCMVSNEWCIPPYDRPSPSHDRDRKSERLHIEAESFAFASAFVKAYFCNTHGVCVLNRYSTFVRSPTTV